MNAQTDTTAEPEQGTEKATRRRILVITPCHNEADLLPRTVASMEGQVLKPALWLLVNDGSTDDTGPVADRAAARNEPWLRVLHRPPRTERSVGPGVIDAFNAGLAAVDLDDYDYVCKFDADLEFGPEMFLGLVERMEAEPRLGTFSGKAWEEIGGTLTVLRTNDDFSMGCCKFYRTETFKEIGGFVSGVMWDGIDCHTCRLKGWRAASGHEERIRMIHLRQMGSSHKTIFFGRRRWGRGQYFMGTHPLYILAIATYRLAESPWLLGGLNILLGYVLAWLGRAPRYENPEFRRHLRAWQLRRIGLGFLAGRSAR